ncbi:MAG: hypothetical protein FJ029_08010 [Actinobacteria bacterium]|nr:hypothetical protein [Actinomycetota bacterium]
MDYATFRNPPRTFGGAPFWSWNDRLSEAELRRQVGEMDAQGWGGFFMHARVGLETPYLGEEWMRSVRACADEAAARGMQAWLYDENRWPSGFAGGKVADLGPEYRLQALVCRRSNAVEPMRDVLAIFGAEGHGGVYTNVRRLDPLAPEPADEYLHFYIWTAPLGYDWFLGSTYVDLLNPAVTAAFIRSTHEAYREAVGQHFGGAVPGIFTDEPRAAWHTGHDFGPPRPSVPWTAALPDIYRERWGAELRDVLPSLFFNVGPYAQARWRFWRTVADRFVDAYTAPLHAWCEQHGLHLTGHQMAEDTLTGQILWSGAVMPHYEYLHIPGIDHLGRNIADTITAKQADSVVNQLGRARLLSETFGCSGQALTFEQRKWIGDWAFVHGVTLMNHHLSLYSMRGERKRDYPPNIFWQQPHWPHQRIVEDYFTRLCYVLSQGRRVVDLAIVHPLGSAWAAFQPDNPTRSDDLHRTFEGMSEALLDAHRDFDYLDERILARHGRVTDGQLVVGQARYAAVVVPPAQTLEASTVTLLEALRQAGGSVLFVVPAPTLVEGLPEPRLSALVGATPVAPDAAAVAAQVARALPRDVSFEAGGHELAPVRIRHRQDGAAHCWFVVNSSPVAPVTGTLHVTPTPRLEAWDPGTGAASELPVRAESGRAAVDVSLPPGGSLLLVNADTGAPPAPTLHYRQRIALDGWTIALDRPNALLLDRARCRLGTGAWSAPDYVLDIADHLRRRVGESFAVRYEFDWESSSERGAEPTGVVVEMAERFLVSLNGRPITQWPDWWVDRSFRRADVSAAIRPGMNVLELAGLATTDVEIEPAYVLGRFAARLDGPRPRAVPLGPLFPGSLTDQGLPFYAGVARYAAHVTLPAPTGEAALDLHGLQGALALVQVNGQAGPAVAWQPHRSSIGPLLRAGANVIEIDVVGTLRNALGPHHHRDGEPGWVSPGSFRRGPHWVDAYQCVPFGLDGADLLLA